MARFAGLAIALALPGSASATIPSGNLVVNGGVIACGFGEPRADALAAEILADVYPGRRVVTVDAREIFARGGGIHCITQQQPRARA